MPNLTTEQLRATVLAGFIRGNVQRAVSSRNPREVLDIVAVIMEAVQPLVERIVALEIEMRPGAKDHPLSLSSPSLTSSVPTDAEEEEAVVFAPPGHPLDGVPLGNVSESRPLAIPRSSLPEVLAQACNALIENQWDGRFGGCPWCGRLPEHGHEPQCQIASAIAAIDRYRPEPQSETVKDVVRDLWILRKRLYDGPYVSHEDAAESINKIADRLESVIVAPEPPAPTMDREALAQIARAAGVWSSRPSPWDELAESSREMYCRMAEATARAVQPASEGACAKALGLLVSAVERRRPAVDWNDVAPALKAAHAALAGHAEGPERDEFGNDHLTQIYGLLRDELRGGEGAPTTLRRLLAELRQLRAGAGAGAV